MDRRDWWIAAALWSVVAAGYVWAAVTAAPVLMGEEASVSMRDVLFSTEHRVQASMWSTNFWAPVYYWAAGHLDPSFSLFTGRQAKAIALALVAPLVFVTARVRLGCERGPAALAAVTVGLLPGVSMFGWVATENGLEAVPGLTGLLLATSRRWWPVAPVLAGFAVGTYTTGIAWAVGIGAACVVAAVRDPRRIPLGLLGASFGVGVVLFPLLWWTAGPQRVVVGGGRVDGSGGDWALLWRLLTESGASYYYFADVPALGSLGLTVVVLVAAAAAAYLRPTVWPWLLVAAGTLALWVPAGNLPGTRRIIPLIVVAALVIGVAVDIAARRIPDGWRRSGCQLLATAGAVGPLLISLLGWVGQRPELLIDWPAPTGPTMVEAFDALDADMRAGRVTPTQLAASTGDSRPAALTRLLADRRGADPGQLPSAADIVGQQYGQQE